MPSPLRCAAPLLLSVIVFGCGGPPAASPAGATGGRTGECARLVERVDAMERDLRTYKPGAEAEADAILRSMARAADRMQQAGQDISAQAWADPEVKPLAGEYGARLGRAAEAMRAAAPDVVKLAALPKRLDETQRGYLAALKSVGDQCKGMHADPDCRAALGVVSEIAAMGDPDPEQFLAIAGRTRGIKVGSPTLQASLTSLAAGVGSLGELLKASAQAKERVDALDEGEDLEKRLHTVCGRPLPKKETDDSP